MIEALLVPGRITILLSIYTVLAPLLARSLMHRIGRRPAIVVMCSGLAVMGLWGVQNLLMRVVGFDSVVTAGVVLLLGTALGWLAGDFLSREDVLAVDTRPTATQASSMESNPATNAKDTNA